MHVYKTVVFIEALLDRFLNFLSQPTYQVQKTQITDISKMFLFGGPQSQVLHFEILYSYTSKTGCKMRSEKLTSI